MSYLDLPEYNNTDFPLSVKESLLKANYDEEIKKKLKYHQFIVKEFMTKHKHQKGLLIKHDMGLGKTRIAVAIAEYFRQYDTKRQIVVLLPKSLEGNFKKTIFEYSERDDNYIQNNYKFVSLNSSNMFKKISNIDKSKEEIDYESRLNNFINTHNSLDNSLLIIDEAHNLFNAITNGSKNGLSLYDLILESKNLKVIFLTGTPIINDPFELVPCFNMLRGYMYLDTKKKSDKVLLFSESLQEFEDYFVDYKNKSIKNKDKFMNRIFGLSSYYGELYFDIEKKKEGFPKKLPDIIEIVKMSQTQYNRYALARTFELDEGKSGLKKKDTRFSASGNSNSTYRVKSRQISNYCIPEYALGPIRGMKSREKFIDKINIDDLKNTDEFSPKMGRIINNIKDKYPNSPGLVYSQFVSGEGIGIFAKILEVYGYENFDDSSNIYDIKNKAIKKYAILSGDIDPEQRDKLIKIFNQKENSDGSIISLLLLSGAVSEGIDLKRIRHVHIMEPFWNYARINQVETRAIRYLSHVDLPEDQQNVQVFIYLSDYPNEKEKEKMKEDTTDIDLFYKSKTNMQIINTFVQAIAESSIDCSVHHQTLPDNIKNKINCLMCQPNHKQLFHPLLNKDMNLPNSCEVYSEKKISVKEIIYEPTGEKYYYKINPKNNNDIVVYMFNKKLNGYTEMPNDNVIYSYIIHKLIM